MQLSFSMVDNEEQQSQSIINGHQQLWIHLKIPKVEEDHNYDQHNFGFEDDEDEGHEIQKKINNSSRICHVCNKVFSSGKALGGHMRIHIQTANKELISRKKRNKLNQPISLYKKRKLEKPEEEVDILKKKKKNGINNDEPPAITCSVCCKKFPSMKSLFGHMRCHPDRDWRGIQPPHNNDQKVPEIASVDLSKAAGGWSVTAKRGRSAKPIIDHDSEEERQVDDAVHYLMLLAYGDSLQSRKHGLVKEELEIMNNNSFNYNTIGTKKRTIEKTQLKIEGTNNICRQMKRIKRRGRKMMKLKDLGSIQDADYQNTIFSTPEKYKNKFNIAPIQNSGEEIDGDSKLLVESTNECNNIIRNSGGGSRILDFDLNEFPLTEDDDDDEAAANHGCVSYSSDFFQSVEKFT